MKKLTLPLMVGVAALSLVNQVASAACPTAAGFPTHAQLREALRKAVCNQATACTAANVVSAALNGGLNFNMWATVVTRGGVVCDVVYSGDSVGAQWPASRAISAQKANTANSLSLPGFALSTANLYSAVQPGGSLYGLQHSNPVSVAAYGGTALFSTFGTGLDPMIGKRIGGVNVFGGGLALYKSGGTLIGGIGVSGDSSCADHNVAWRTRNNLSLDFVPNGVSGTSNGDKILYDIKNATGTEIGSATIGASNIPSLGVSTSGFGHPKCSGTEDTVAGTLPATQ